ncbi:MAG: hypothetical protein ABSG98_09110 [Anaerolineales bacterium]|jgi:hypothetical protein
MDHGMIGKIEKAKRYAEQPERFQFHAFELTFRGDNNDHVVRYERGSWSCDCEFFALRGVCSHTMALERLLEPMIAHKVSA